MIGLHELRGPSRQARKRVGRGHGSGRGSYAGRGVKGQRARSGGRRAISRRSLKALIERLPKVRGGHPRPVPKPQPVSLASLERRFAAGERVTRVSLQAKRLIPAHQTTVVILGGSRLTKPLVVEAHRVSVSARRAISTAGGRVIELPAEPRRRRRSG